MDPFVPVFSPSPDSSDMKKAWPYLCQFKICNYLITVGLEIDRKLPIERVKHVSNCNLVKLQKEASFLQSDHSLSHLYPFYRGLIVLFCVAFSLLFENIYLTLDRKD